MRGLVVIILMVMMLCLMAPMTAMAIDKGAVQPPLIVTMEKWADIVTAQATLGAEQPRPHEGKLHFIDYTVKLNKAQAMISAEGIEMSDNISATIEATGNKAGGEAIFASGQPGCVPVNLII